MSPRTEQLIVTLEFRIFCLVEIHKMISTLVARAHEMEIVPTTDVNEIRDSKMWEYIARSFQEAFDMYE